jgi:hypothetical protein
MLPERYILVSRKWVSEGTQEQMLEETMLRLKMSGWRTAGSRMTGKRLTGARSMAGVLAMGLLMAGAAQGQFQSTSAAPQTTTTTPTTLGKIGLAAPVSYDNRYEVYGGLNFMNFQAGQQLPKRMNLGGGELLGTYWLPGDHWFTRNIGVGVDYRFDAGTTPVLANQFVKNRPLVYMHIAMLGAQYRGPRNQFVSLNYHGYFGVGDGIFDYSLKDIPPGARPVVGLYTNRVKPMAALGASLDFNRSKNWAIRISPDLILEHFGTETREFVSVSGGVVYRFNKKR